MNEISIFKFEESFTIRSVVKDSEPWFVAKDVCEVLGLTNPSEALKSLDSDEKSTLRNPEGRGGVGAQCFNIINESGLYALVIRSNKPNARKFRKWITAEVLPAIRKTGRYAAPVQPELPMNAPAEPFSPLKYKGIEVIPGGELRMRLGITEGQLGFWLHRYNPMIEGVDVFHINGVTDKLAFAMLKCGFTVSPNIISVTLYTRSGFVKAAARFKPDLIQADFTRAMEAATEKVLPLPRLAPDVSPDNFTFRAGWFDHDSKTTFGDTAIVRFCRELLNMGYDPSGLLSEFYAAHTAAAMGGKILDILYTITGDVLENSSLLAATSARMRIEKAEMANVSFHADGSIAG